MITREDYLNALEVVDKYHRQFLGTNTIISARVKIEDFITWCDDYHHITKRLRGVLNRDAFFVKETPSHRPFIYLDEVVKFVFLKTKGAGKLTWSEFQDLRDMYNSKH